MDGPGYQFRDQSQTAFPWLRFEKGKMFYMVCTSQVGTTGEFIDGNTSFSRYSLTHHAERYMCAQDEKGLDWEHHIGLIRSAANSFPALQKSSG